MATTSASNTPNNDNKDSDRDFVQRDLFGGALVADFPASFSDVSDIRQVPDHQEVWLDTEGFTSIVVEILERVDVEDDIQALHYHLHELVGTDADHTKIWTQHGGSRESFAHLPEGTPACYLFATAPPGEKQRGRANEAEFVGILLTLVRLRERKTDLLIAVNVPHVLGQGYVKEEVDLGEEKLGPLLKRAGVVRERVARSLEIKDWGLFVTE